MVWSCVAEKRCAFAPPTELPALRVVQADPAWVSNAWGSRLNVPAFSAPGRAREDNATLAKPGWALTRQCIQSPGTFLAQAVASADEGQERTGDGAPDGGEFDGDELHAANRSAIEERSAASVRIPAFTREVLASRGPLTRDHTSTDNSCSPLFPVKHLATQLCVGPSSGGVDSDAAERVLTPSPLR